MRIKRTAIVPKTYKDASYLTFAGGGSGGSNGSSGTYGGSGGFSTSDVQKLMKNIKDKKKQEIKTQIREYKRQIELEEELHKQEREALEREMLKQKLETEEKIRQLQQYTPPQNVMDRHTRKISENRKERIFLCDMIETNPKEENAVIKIIKNIGKKKPPKNMTIVQ